MWTFQGQPHLTAAVKATYLIGADGTLDGPVASPILPVELSDRPNEVAPALTQAEVHVRTAATGVFHLAVYQGQKALLTKSAATGDLGMVPPTDSSRQAMAGIRGERLIQLPKDFEWEALHAAPSDQRVPRLAGDEWLVFGFDEKPPQRVRLPGVRAEVRAYGNKAPAFSTAVLDMVLLEVDARQLSLVWRARAHVKDAFRLASLKVVGRLDSGPPFGDTAPDDVEAKGTYLETSPPPHHPAGTTSASPLPPEAAMTALQSTMATSGPTPDTALPFDPGMAPKIEIMPATATPSRHPTGTGAMPAFSKEDVQNAVRPPTAAASTRPLVETADVPAGGADLGGTMFGSAPTGAAVPFAEPSSPAAPGRASPPPPASPWAGDEPSPASTRGAPPSARGAPPAVPRAPAAPPPSPAAPRPIAGRPPETPAMAGTPPAPPPAVGEAPAPPPAVGKAPAPPPAVAPAAVSPDASAPAAAPPSPSAPSDEELAARARAREEAQQQRKREVEAELRAIREEAEEMRKEEERLRAEAQRREERARIEEEQRRQAEQEKELKARMAKRAAQQEAERERAERLRSMLYGFRTK